MRKRQLKPKQLQLYGLYRGQVNCARKTLYRGNYFQEDQRFEQRQLCGPDDIPDWVLRDFGECLSGPCVRIVV